MVIIKANTGAKMLPTQPEVRSDNSKTHANVAASPTLAHIDSFHHPLSTTTKTTPIEIPETEINNNQDSVITLKNSDENWYLRTGYHEHGFSIQNSFKYTNLNGSGYNPNKTEETAHKTQVNSPKDSLEHVSNMFPLTFTGCSKTFVTPFYRFTNTTTESERIDRNLERPQPANDVERPCKKRRLSGTQNQRTQISQNQMVHALKTFHNDQTNYFVPYSNSESNASNMETRHKTSETPCHSYAYHSPPHYLPLYHPPMLHGLPVSESQQAPHAPDSSMTYLTPSQQTPIMSTSQTRNERTKKVCQRRLSSPADSEKSCDRSCDEEVDVINDTTDTSITGDTSRDSDISMISGKSSLSTSPSVSSVDSSPTISPEDLCRKKTRTNYTPRQVHALEKVFHNNPYPDAEKMEHLSEELDIPENKLKVWFQNKRARWRRRMNDNPHHVPRYMGLSPVMPNYGFMGQMMPPPISPAQVVPGPFVRNGPPTSLTDTPEAKITTHMTPPNQSRGHFPSYVHMYPYGMFSPYYYS